MNRQDFIKILGEHGVFFDHHGARHDIFIHKQTGKKIPVPRHGEMKNKFLKLILKEIPKN
jgi:predicted RNA binding protein YcfA (HicA-like mRNA interferase family)